MKNKNIQTPSNAKIETNPPTDKVALLFNVNRKSKMLKITVVTLPNCK